MTSEDSTVKRDFEEIKSNILLEQSPIVRRETKPRFRLILGVAVQAMQQLTGINIICYYLPYVLHESVGLSGSTSRLLAAVNAMTYLGSTFIGLFFIERWGRRRLMMYGALGQCCCWLAITILLHSTSTLELKSTRQQQLSSTAVFFFFLFNCFFGSTWQGVSWLYPTEINSTQNRISGMSYGVATNWLINFGVVFITPLGIEKLGWQFYAIWTVLNGFIMGIIYTFYIETAGRSLEDIDVIFEEHPTIWVFAHPSMTARKPSAPTGNPDRGDDISNPRTEDHGKTYSRNVSAIELAPQAQLRHRQPGGVTTSLGSMTPVQTIADNVAGADAKDVASGAGDNEDAVYISIPLSRGETGQMSPQVTQMSSTALL